MALHYYVSSSLYQQLLHHRLCTLLPSSDISNTTNSPLPPISLPTAPPPLATVLTAPLPPISRLTALLHHWLHYQWPLPCRLHYQWALHCQLHYQQPNHCQLHYQWPLYCQLHYQWPNHCQLLLFNQWPLYLPQTLHQLLLCIQFLHHWPIYNLQSNQRANLTAQYYAELKLLVISNINALAQ